MLEAVLTKEAMPNPAAVGAAHGGCCCGSDGGTAVVLAVYFAVGATGADGVLFADAGTGRSSPPMCSAVSKAAVAALAGEATMLDPAPRGAPAPLTIVA